MSYSYMKKQASNKWFEEAINQKPPYHLGGWEKTQSSSVRRRNAYNSRPADWSKKKRYLSSARALQALSNVTTDKKTKLKAAADAKYFFKLAKKQND